MMIHQMGVAVAFKYHELVSFDMVKVIASIRSSQTSMNSSKKFVWDDKTQE